MTKQSDAKMIELFRRQLRVLRERRDSISAGITSSREMIKQSRAMIVEIDEQINQMERELGLGSDQCLRKQPSSALKN
jgi:uncharacterized coiled-coil DUF342 family protein